MITLHQCCINFIGLRCVRANQPTFKLAMNDHLQGFKCFRGLAPLRRPTWLTCASPFRRSSAGGSCGRLTAGHSSCQVPGLRSIDETAVRVGPAATWNSLLVVLRTSSLSSQTFAKKTKITYSAASASEDKPFNSVGLPFNCRYINMRIHSFTYIN